MNSFRYLWSSLTTYERFMVFLAALVVGYLGLVAWLLHEAGK